MRTTEQVARLHYQHFNERRWDAAVELIHAEAVFHTLPTRQRLVGIAGYGALVAAWLEVRNGQIVRAQLDFDERALRRHLLAGSLAETPTL